MVSDPRLATVIVFATKLTAVISPISVLGVVNKVSPWLMLSGILANEIVLPVIAIGLPSPCVPIPWNIWPASFYRM